MSHLVRIGSAGGAMTRVRLRDRRLLAGLLGLLLVTALQLTIAPPATANTEPPYVIGLTLDQATAMIEQDWYPGSSVVPVVATTPTIPDGFDSADVFVLDTTDVRYLEDSDDVNPFTGITLVVGAEVPNLMGLSASAALGVVNDLGFELTTEGEGNVVRQLPEAGSHLPFGSAIQVTLAIPPPETAVVPDLTGQSEDSARTMVEGVGLTFLVTSQSGEAPLLVVGQYPPPGTQLTVGQPVSATLEGSALPRTVVVPDLTGKRLPDVQAALTALSLVLRVDPDGDGRRGFTAREDPSAGTIVLRGSPVTVTFAVPIVVPPPASDSGFPWTVVLVGVVAVLVAAAAVLLVRGRRPRPVRAIRFVPHVDEQPVVSVRRAAGAVDVAIEVRPHPEAGEVTLKERI